MDRVPDSGDVVDIADCGLPEPDLRRLLGRHERGSVVGVYRLTPLQNGLLFDSQGASNAGNYVTQSVYEVSGAIDLESFVASWQYVCSRHDALRTTFEWTDLPHPVQLVRRSAPADVVEHDWSRLDGETSRARLEELLRKRRARSFTLADAPPLAFDIIRVDATRSWVAWHVHHLVIDGPSSSVVLGELVATYKAVRDLGRPVDLPPVRQYREHLRWLARQDTQADAERWRTIMGDLEEPTVLSCIRRPADRRDHAAASVVQTLPGATHRALVVFARHHGISLHAMLQAAWALVLASRSQASDICWGTIFSGRSRMDPGADRLVGLVVNTVPARVRVDPDEAVGAYLRRVQRMLAQVHDVEHVGLKEIQSLTRVRGGEPLFETTLQFIPRSQDDEAADADLTIIRSQEQTGYPLEISLIAGRGLRMHLTYEPDRVDESTARQVVQQFTFVLEQLCTVDGALRDIEWLPPEEAAVLSQWSTAVDRESSNDTIPVVFDRVHHANPAGRAVIDGSGAQTYDALERASNALANGLLAHGVMPGDTVGVAVPRTSDLVVALLGVLKAGAAYLIVDRRLPEARREVMLQECGVELVVQADDALPRPDQRAGLLQISPRQLMSAASTEPMAPGRGHHLVDSTAVAFVTYTSGTTGRPKCIGMSHGNLTRIAVSPDYYSSGPGRCFVQLAPPEFDVSIEEIWGAILNGATVVMPGDRTLDLPEIEELLREHPVTNVSMTTGLFHLFAEEAPTAFANVDELVIGGDIARPGPCARILAANPMLTLVNAYGPTEMSVTTTSYIVRPGLSFEVPIGRPIKGTTVYVLDSHLRRVPIGVTGELYAAGAGLTLGYLNDARLTAERFRPDPFCSDAGRRMYATGDYARWSETGELEFVGRTDRQVKVRGFRVEPGEIESCLTQHPSVAEAVVEAAIDGEDAKRLVAYVVPRRGTAFDRQDLRLHVAAALPHFMVPSLFVRLDELPLTSVGKVDRRRLPGLDAPSEEAREDQFALTSLEQILLRVWTEALGNVALSCHSNFFDAGGDSMVSMRVAAAARRSGIAMSSSDVFRHQTISELASMLETREAAERVDQEPLEGDVGIIPIQRWFLRHHDAENWFSQSRVLRREKPIAETIIERVLGEVVRHHDGLRLRVRREGGVWRQWFAKADAERSFVLETHALESCPQAVFETRLREIGESLRSAIDLSSGPLLAAALVHSPGEHDDALILVAHHWTMDLVSWSVLLEDIEDLYGAFERGSAAALSDKTSSFRAWSDRLHEMAQEEMRLQATRAAVPYATGSRLPRDRAIPEGTSGTRHLRVTLSASESANFVRAIRAHRSIRAHELILGAATPVFREWLSGGTVAVDVEFHGRDASAGDLDVSRTIGWFTAISTVVLQLDDVDTFGGYLRRVRDSLPQDPDDILRTGVRRYLLADGEAEAEICFTYLGEVGGSVARRASFRSEGLDTGAEHNEGLERGYPLDINVGVEEGRLFLDIASWRSQWSDATIERFAGELLHQIGRSIGQLATWEMDRTHPAVWLRRLRKDTPLLTLPMQRYGVPGVSVATTVEGEITSWTFGDARRGGEPIDVRTRFQVGSIAKHFETIAVLRLCEAGPLSLDARLSEVAHGPRTDSLVGAERISVRDLLRHRSGLSSEAGERGEVVAVGTPGDAYAYDLVNFELIEEMLEYVLDAPIADVLAEWVLQPLGLQGTGFHPAVPDPSDAAGLAVGHSAAGREYRPRRRPAEAAVEQEFWSTASDIAVLGLDLHRAIRGDDGVLLRRQSAAMLWGGVRAGYGLGTVIKQLNGLSWIGHPGDGPGFRSIYALEPEGGNGIVVLANSDAATPMIEDLLVELGTDLVMRVRGSLMDWDLEDS
jgi:amino acid adenylation domain-containing protein